MPNHLHGIVAIDKKENYQGADYFKGEDHFNGASLAPLQEDKRKPKSLSSFIGGFKSSVTKTIKPIYDHPNPVIWQCNYYENIVRDENQLNQIREYIINNPQKWDEDPEKLDNLSTEILTDFYF
ncbi:MAG: transposase [Snowella sp.]